MVTTPPRCGQARDHDRQGNSPTSREHLPLDRHQSAERKHGAASTARSTSLGAAFAGSLTRAACLPPSDPKACTDYMHGNAVAVPALCLYMTCSCCPAALCARPPKVEGRSWLYEVSSCMSPEPSTARLCLLKPSEVAAQLGVSRSWLYDAAKTGRIPSIRIGGEGGPLRFVPSDLQRWIDEARAAWTPGCPTVATRHPAAAPRLRRRPSRAAGPHASGQQRLL